MYKKIALMSSLLVLNVGIHASQLLDKVVAVVNNSVITASELDKQVILAKKQLQAQRMEVPAENVLKKQVLNRLIDVNLQMQMAKEHNLIIDDTELSEAIEKIARANNATVSEMREELTRQGMNWEEYRENIRKEMLLANLQQKAVGREVMVSPEQVEQYIKLEGDGPVDRSHLTYHLQNILIPLDDEPSPLQVKQAQQKAQQILLQVKKGAELSHLAVEHSTSEMTLESTDLGMRHLAELPELYVKEVVRMKAGDSVGPIRAGNGFQIVKLLAIGGENATHLVTKTHVRHILLKPDAHMLPEDAKKQVQNIYQQLKSGKDFALMAKQHSLDTISAAKGGDLGWVTPGELVPAFEQAMNKLPLHQVSKPVKSQFGWHLIEVLERKQQDDSLAFKKQQIRLHLQQRKFAEAVQSWQHHIRMDAYVNILEKDLA